CAGGPPACPRHGQRRPRRRFPQAAAAGRRVARHRPRRHNADATRPRAFLFHRSRPVIRRRPSLSACLPMNQTRVFLIIAWLMVATLLWMEWNREQSAPPAESPVAAGSTVPQAVPAAVGADASIPSVPQAAAPVAPSGEAPADSSTPAVTVRTDVLEVDLQGGEVTRADLLAYPASNEPDSPPVRLFSDAPGDYFVAQSGWVSNAGVAPTHEAGWELDRSALSGDTDFRLDEGEQQVVVPFVWQGPDGVLIRRSYTFERGQYVVQVRDEVVNQGTRPWQGFVYRQLARVPRAIRSTGPMSPEGYSFQGAAWYSPAEKYERRPYDDFIDDGPLNRQVTGGWIAFLQHHFFGAWIPESGDTTTFSLATPRVEGGGTRYLIREVGPGVSVAPGATAGTSARLWVGPKLSEQINAQGVPGLERAVDFSRFSVMATLAGWLFWVLER